MDEIIKQQSKILKTLNDNIVKLANVISLVTRQRPINGLPPNHTAEIINFPNKQPQSSIVSPAQRSSRTRGNDSDQPNSQTNSQLERKRIERESIVSGGKYLPGVGDYLAQTKNKFTSIEGFFDLDKSSGLLANLLKKRVASNQYVKDQMALNPDKKDLPGYERTLRDQFNKQQKIQKQQQQVSSSIAGLKSRGYSEEQIKRSGLIDKQRDLDNQMALVNPSYKEQRTAERIANLRTAREAKKEAEANSKKSSQSNSDSITTEEERENIILMKEQNTSLKNIESNTAVLPEFVKVIDGLAKNIDKLSRQPQSTRGGPGVMPDIDDFLNRNKNNAPVPVPAKKPGPTYRQRVASAARGAFNYVRANPRALLRAGGVAAGGWLAGSALEYGGEKLKEHGYEETGKAVSVGGSALKYAGIGAAVGSLVPGAGTAAGAAIGGAVGAGVGIYDQYFADDSDKAKLLAKPEQGNSNIPGVGPIEYEATNNNYTINKIPVDKETYQDFSKNKNAYFQPETHPNYANFYKKSLENLPEYQGLELRQVKAQQQAASMVREVVSERIKEIVSSLKASAKTTPTSRPAMTSKLNDAPKQPSAVVNNINRRDVVTPIQSNIVNRSNPNTNVISNTTDGSVTKNITELNYEQMAAPAGSNFTLANNVVPFPGSEPRAVGNNISSVESGSLAQLPVLNQPQSIVQPIPAKSEKIIPIRSTGGEYGEAIYKTSASNAATAASLNNNKQQAPVVVNAPSTNVNNNSTIAAGTKFARNGESSIQQYNKSRFF